MIRQSAVLGLILGLAACGDTPESRTATTFTDSVGITIASSDPALAPACSLSAEPRTVIGVAAGDSLHELYRVFGTRRLSTGQIAVANQGSQQVRLYDADGRFVRAFGREGDGPGEFRNVFGLWRLAGDTLWVGDYRPWRYQVYTAGGEWVRTVQPEPLWPNPPTVWGMLSGGRAVLGEPVRSTPDRTFPEAELVVTLHDPDGTTADTLARFPYGRWGRVEDDPASPIIYPFFDAVSEMAAAADRLAIGHGREPSVSLIAMARERSTRPPDTPLPQPSLILRWDTDDRTVSAADVEAEKQRLRDRYADVDPRFRSRMLDPLISDHRPAADVFPAYVTLTFGTDGSLWVTEYPLPEADAGRDHLVFDADGTLRCRVHTPEGFTLDEPGAGYLLGLHQDDTGVERVLLYGLTVHP